MKSKLAAAAAALTLSVGLMVVPATAQAAPILPAFTPVGTYRADLDGDGRSDTITVSFVDQSGMDVLWDIAVKTAKGVKATTGIITDASAGKSPVSSFAYLDGVKGKELKIRYEDRRISSDVRLVNFRVFTWRSGKLVLENAPDDGVTSANTSPDWVWFTSKVAYQKAKDGYRFYTSNGYRYAEHFTLDYFDSVHRWKGTIARSKWKSGRWYDIKRFPVSLTSTQAAKYVAIATATPS